LGVRREYEKGRRGKGTLQNRESSPPKRAKKDRKCHRQFNSEGRRRVRGTAHAGMTPELSSKKRKKGYSGGGEGGGSEKSKKPSHQKRRSGGYKRYGFGANAKRNGLSPGRWWKDILIPDNRNGKAISEHVGSVPNRRLLRGKNWKFITLSFTGSRKIC